MRNSKPTQDTFTAAQAAVAQRILNSTLAQYVGYPGSSDEVRLGTLRRLANGEGKPGAWNFISVEFRRAGSNCTLSISAESDSFRGQYEQDDDGNDYDSMQLLPVQLNWPCHGSLPVGSAFALIEFYRDVVRLAADIDAEFQGSHRYWRLARTKAEREESEARVAATKVKDAVTAALEDVRTGARCGGAPKSMPLDLLKDIPAGSYDHEFADNKKFHLEVRRDGDVVMGMWSRTV